MINVAQIRELVIQPALNKIRLYSPEDEEMLIAISAQETKGGFYLKQTIGGDKAALGIYQMQPDTHDWIWNTTLTKDSNLGFLLQTSCGYTLRPKPETMVYNLLYASMMARVFWLHVDTKMPAVDDREGRWVLYKKYWNTYAGKATENDFFANYEAYAGKGK